MSRSQATTTHCSKGHLWTEETLYVNPSNGQRVCRQCARDYSKTARRKRSRSEWYQQGGKDSMNRARRARQYDLTPEQWQALSDEQQGLCKVCRRPPPEGRSLDTDHCHTTSRVRGLLCPPCNLILGLAQDDPQRLRDLALYLE
jgi:hypothetical protein